MPADALLSERCRHTTAIVVLNGLVIFECVFMLARATNPFFGAMDKPSPGFIAFMLAQIALLGAAVLLTVGTCACKEKLVAGNRYLFFAVALANVVYGTIFVVRKDLEGGVTFYFGALLAVFGAMLCARFLVMLSHELLPTQSPAFTPHKDIRVNVTATRNAKTSSFPPGLVYPNGDCVRDHSAATTWWLDPDDDAIEGCLHEDDGEAPWVMLRAYVAGSGKLGVHWKWVNTSIDGATEDCMTDWTMFSCNGTVLEEHMLNAVGMEGDLKWCPLPVFVPEGKEGVTWVRCGHCCGRCEGCDEAKSCPQTTCDRCVLA